MNEWFLNQESKKMGLVLGGGGARGCYEVGMWQAFTRVGLHFDIVAGTSIGALVGAMYTQKTLDRIEDFVWQIHPQAIAENLFDFPETFSQLLKERKQINKYLETYILSSRKMDISPLKKAIADMFDYERFMRSDINYACMTFNLTTRRPEAYFKKEMTPENAQDIILASASCYPAFPMMEMNGCDYIDGGYYSNVPIRLAVEMGAEKILAVDVEGPGVVRSIPKGVDVLLIKPMLPLQNFLDFSNEQCIRCMNIGFLETNKLLGIFAGYLFTFVKEDVANMMFMEQYLRFMFQVYGVTPDAKTMNGIVRFAAGFHPSGLSREVKTGYDYGQMVEALAYLVQIEPVMLYNYFDFVKILLEKLNAITIRHSQANLSETISWMRSLTKEEILALLHKILVNQQGMPNEHIRILRRLFPSEMALAYVWYFLEAAYEQAIDH